MKYILLLLTLLSSCGKLESLSQNNLIRYNEPSGSEGASVEDRELNKKPSNSESEINTKYEEKNAIACIAGLIVLSPVIAVVDGIDRILTSNKVDINFSKSLIYLVKDEVFQYILENSQISPDDFFGALSAYTREQFELEMIRAFSDLSPKDFQIRKQMMAYAFLYFIQNGSPLGESYSFTYDGRGELKRPQPYRAFVSFAGSDLRENVKEVGACGYFRFTEVSVNQKIRDEILCSNNDLDIVRLSYTDNKEYLLNVITKDKEQSFILDNLEMNNSDEMYELIHNPDLFDGYPEITLDFEKRSFYENNQKVILENSAEKLDLLIKTSFFKTSLKIKDLSCRSYGELSLE